MLRMTHLVNIAMARAAPVGAARARFACFGLTLTPCEYWIVNNDGDIYTVDRDTFARTYGAVSTGIYKKLAPVWAGKEAQSTLRSGRIWTQPDGIDVTPNRGCEPLERATHLQLCRRGLRCLERMTPGARSRMPKRTGG